MKHNLGLMVVWLEPASTLPFELRAQAVSYDHEDGHVESVLALRCCIKSTSTGKMYMGGAISCRIPTDVYGCFLLFCLPHVTPLIALVWFEKPSKLSCRAFVAEVCRPRADLPRRRRGRTKKNEHGDRAIGAGLVHFLGALQASPGTAVKTFS